MMKRADLKKFSVDEDIPFGQVLGWYVVGLVLYLSGVSGFNENLVICEPHSLDPRQDIHILEEGITCYYIEDERVMKADGFVPGCAYTRDFTARLLLQVQGAAVKEGLPLVIKVGSGTRVEFSYDGMYVPLEVRIRPKKDLYPENIRFDFFDPDIEGIDLRVYPKEYQAADDICEIMEKLELINDMEVYLYLYRLIAETSLSARDICQALREEKKQGFKERTFQVFSGYLKSTYMKKKWKVLLRRHRIKEPGWEETMELLIKFIGPLWDTLSRGEHFFGDWMPELRRYLE